MSYPQEQTYPTPTPTEPPLWAPFYGANPFQAVKRFFAKYATFTGRASRSEYWWWNLASTVIGIVLVALYLGLGFIGATASADGTMVPGPGALLGGALLAIFSLGTIIPSLAVAVRRLHDANLSGWLLLLALMPFFGGATILVLTLLGPNPAGQRFDRPTV